MEQRSTPQEDPSDFSHQVLVVEDNPLNQLLLTTLLRRYSIQPHIANNGLEAVQFLETQSVDLILMDIQMPIMDGLSATRQIRKQLGLATPIVAVTSLDDEDIRDRCRDAGMNDYVRKPITRGQLEQLIDQYLRNKSTVGESVSNKILVDRAYLDEITNGNRELLGELMATFRERLPGFRQKLFEEAQSGQQAAFSQSAHFFRSALHSLALLGTAARLRTLEKNPDLPGDELTRQLNGLFDEIETALTILDTLANPHP